MRPGMIGLGLGMGLLWVLGLVFGQPAWITWLDFLAALLSLAAPAIRSPSSTTGPRSALLTAGPFSLGIGVGLLWIIALASGVSEWMTWLNFVGAVAYLLLGFGMAGERGVRPITGPHGV